MGSHSGRVGMVIAIQSQVKGPRCCRRAIALAKGDGVRRPEVERLGRPLDKLLTTPGASLYMAGMPCTEPRLRLKSCQENNVAG
jgi:hypothetical protein